MINKCKFCGQHTDAMVNLVNIRGNQFHMSCFFDKISDENYKKITKTIDEITKLEKELEELIK